MKKESKVDYHSAIPTTHDEIIMSDLGVVLDMLVATSPLVPAAPVSLLDEIARDALRHLLAVAALEAGAYCQSTAQYYGQRFPHAVRQKRRKELMTILNEHGAHHPEIDVLLREMLALLYSLRRSYPPLADMINFVIIRVQNLQAEPAVDLQRYYTSPRGPIREVMRTMQVAGASKAEIVRQAKAYRRWTAAAVAPAITSGELFKRLLFLVTR